MGDTATHKDKHEFALYKESLSLLIQYKVPGDSFSLSDETLFHRMMTVLRLKNGDQCILFDRDAYIIVIVDAFVGKKQVQVTINSIHSTVVLQPQITFLLPMLKREDYEAALYSLVEVGVNSIQLIFTQKTGNKWVGERDKERAQRIMIAAAEQSKNFAYPQLHEPISLQEALKKYSNCESKLFFDPQGNSFFDIMHMLHSAQPSHILLLVGPEGDLTLEEKEIARKNKFVFCALTSTIMRAVQATGLAAGFIRSLLV
jgi:16S rRNA (uracil1498-N3)-methyltransferase